MPGDDERDRESAQWGAASDAPRVPLAGWQDGVTLGGGNSARNRKELLQDHGLPGLGDAGGGARSKGRFGITGSCWPKGI